MTNREKYIDNASDKALAEKIVELMRSNVYSRWCDMENIIKNWLSQEVVEIKKETSKPIQLTEEEYKSLLSRIGIIEETLGFVRKIGKLKVSGIPIEDKTADEMFEELGYRMVEGENPYWIEYHCEEREDNNYEGEIINIKLDGEYYYKTDSNNKYGVGISETEDKAIHKKIEELKNEK